MFKTLVLILCTLLIACCAAISQPSRDFDKTSNHSAFPKVNNSFINYKLAVDRYLQQHSLKNRTVAQIRLNLPFDFQASKKVAYNGRFLLFHGLNDSPYVWLDFAEQMVARGFDVRAILLEGHGSHPRKMINVDAKDWLTSARKHYTLWSAEKAGPLYLGGFSMGAVLATSIAIDHPEVKGLFLVSPAFHSQLNDILRFSWIYSKFKTWLFGQMLWEDNPSKYNSITINSASAYYDLTQHLKAKWADHKLDIALLMVHSLNDSVVDVQFSREIFTHKFISPQKKLLLYSQSNKGANTSRGEEFRNSYYPGRRILNQSHLSLLNNSNNILLGKARKVLICNGNEYPIFIACMNSNQHWYGAQHTLSPDGLPVARSTYNPDFYTIVKRFEEIFVSRK